MALNIKNDEAQRLARELADLTGLSLTAAVTLALREQIERVRASRETVSQPRFPGVIAPRSGRIGTMHSPVTWVGPNRLESPVWTWIPLPRGVGGGRRGRSRTRAAPATPR